MIDVIVAGAGPTGMMLAGELALAGTDVQVVERRPTSELVGMRARGFHARTIEILDFPDPTIPIGRTVDVPLVGAITAGQPILAHENIEANVPLPQEFVGDGQLFMLRVRGESMIGRGIHDGDYVVVRQQQTVDNGEIVVALLGEEATVKTFYRERDRVRLQPENPTMEPILCTDVTILGKVVMAIRTFQ